MDTALPRPSPARRRLLLLLALAALLLGARPPGARADEPEGEGLLAGAASVALDGGHGRAHALVLHHGAVRVTLVSVDLPVLAAEVLAQAAPPGRRPDDAWVLAATRSQSKAPVGGDPVGGDPVGAAAAVRRAAAEAAARLAPARLALLEDAASSGPALRALRVTDREGATRALLLHGALPAHHDLPARVAGALEDAGVASAVLLLAAPGAGPGAGGGGGGGETGTEVWRERLCTRLERARPAAPRAGAPDALAAAERRVPLRTALLPLLASGAAPPHGMGTVEAPTVTLRLGDLVLTTVPGAVPHVPPEHDPEERTRDWLVPFAQAHLGALSAPPGELETPDGPALFDDDALERLLAPATPAAAEPEDAPSTGPLRLVEPLEEGPPGTWRVPDGSALGARAGRQRRAEVRALLQAWLAARRDARRDATPADAAERAWRGSVAAARRASAAWPEAWRAELRALAEAADVPLDALRLLNVDDPAEAGPRAPAAAQAAALLREATSMGQPLHLWSSTAAHGRVLAPFVEPTLVEPVVGNPFLCLRAPGMLGAAAGLNAQGLSISCERFAAPEGFALAAAGTWTAELALRHALEMCDTLDEAQRALGAAPLVGGVRFLVVDGRRLEARVIERLGERVQVRRDQDGLLLQCDPQAGVECFLTACDPAIPRSGTGTPAARRLAEVLGGEQGTVRAPLLAALAAEPGLRGPDTLGLCVADPALLRVSVACGGDLDAEQALPAFEDLRLLDLLSPERRAAFAPPWRVEPGEGFTLGPVTSGPDGVRLRDVTFASAAPSGHERNDSVHGVLYEPPATSGAGPRGAVIALPAWKEGNLAAQGLLALRLAREGYVVLVMPLPWQVDRAAQGVSSGAWTLSADLARTRAAFLQGAADVVKAARWLRATQRLPAARVAVMGVSLGGHVAALAYGAYPDDLGAGVFLLAGGDLSRAMLSTNRLTGRIRAQLLERGVTPLEARPLIHDVDGVTWARPERGPGVLVVGADADDVVPPENVRALAAAYGGARLEWLPGDHYAILRHLGRVLDWVVEHLHRTIGRP